jgi:hypothetical protein
MGDAGTGGVYKFLVDIKAHSVPVGCAPASSQIVIFLELIPNNRSVIGARRTDMGL